MEWCVWLDIPASMVHAALTDYCRGSKKECEFWLPLLISVQTFSNSVHCLIQRQQMIYGLKSIFSFSVYGLQKSKAMLISFRPLKSLSLISFIIAVLIICDSTISLCGSFCFYKISFILVGVAILQSHELFGRSISSLSKNLHQLSTTENFHQLSSPKDFR